MADEESAVEVVVEVPTVDLTEGAGGVEYVVQRAGTGEDVVVWTDIARVVVPARTKRATIIRAACDGLAVRGADGIPVIRGPVTVRVLDAGAAREHVVSLRERAPELVIG